MKLIGFTGPNELDCRLVARMLILHHNFSMNYANYAAPGRAHYVDTEQQAEAIRRLGGTVVHICSLPGPDEVISELDVADQKIAIQGDDHVLLMTDGDLAGGVRKLVESLRDAVADPVGKPAPIPYVFKEKQS